ncbi:MAG TPA: hypothetical protein VHA74_03260 [Candidatus Dojkabacteria bacterium]|nr:hypothetical protein [Candidatus Dojkabacteria bacterium]
MSNIVFSKKQTNIKKREINLFQKIFFKPKPLKKHNDRVNKVKVNQFVKIFLLSLISIIALILISIGIYFAVKSAIFLKSTSQDKNLKIESVSGFPDIPTYPNSTFAFINISNDEYVRKFLNSGKSVYILPIKTTNNDVYNYYIDKLPNTGWSHILSVPYESEQQRYGEYWLKNGKGLRVYIDGNDVWYETLTENEAKTGLSDEVKQEAELQLLLSSGSMQDLRPDYPWVLQIPSKYLITYKATDFGELLATEIKDITTKDLTVIYPIGYYGAQPLDVFLDKYVALYNKANNKNWKVLTSVVSPVNDLDAIKATLINGSKSGEAYVIQNTRNNVAYVIMSFNSNNPLLKYIVEKIAPAAKPIP